MATRTVALTWLALVLLLLTGAASAKRPLVLDGSSPDILLHPYLSHLHDPEGRASLAEAVELESRGRFAPLQSTALGFQPGATWLHARVTNLQPQEPRWLLVQRFALSDRLDVYLRHPDGRVTHQAGGDALAFDARSIPYRHPNFWLHLPLDQPVDLFIRIESESSMQIPFVLQTPTAFTGVAGDAQLGIGLYYGILLALLFYNLVLWLSLRDANYFWYVFHIAAFGMVLFALNGLGFEYLWPESPRFAQLSVPLLICLAQIGKQQFARAFLDLRIRWSFGDRVSLVLMVFFVLLGIATLWMPIGLSTRIASAAVFPSIGWIVVSSIVVIRAGYKPAWLFLLAWAMFLLGTAMFAAIAFGLVPKNFVTEYGVQIGSAIEMLLLSVALGYRYSSLRNENERIVQAAKLELEQKVERRTSELSNALAQLGDAHARLRESSQRDSLTGLHTRSYFREAYTPLLSQAREQREPLSILMIDIDHFKRINDHYGHLTGDECLRSAAHRIGQALRPYRAELARFGGEEFVAALPGMDRDAARDVAERILAQLRELPCLAHEHVIPLTASIGVHQVDPQRERGIEAALGHADQALYDAKNRGRDRVCVSAPPA